jgi:hypothetical protein
MDAETIVEQLTVAHAWPHAALAAAGAHRAELVPLFLREIETHLAISPEDREFVPTPFFFAVHLLAEWRETSAYRPLLSLLRLPNDEIDDIFSDALTETLARTLASVYDGDPQPMIDIIHDPNAEETVRWQLVTTLAILVVHGKLDRAWFVEFLRDCYTALPQSYQFVWIGWMQAVAALGIVELKPLVQRAYAAGFVALDFYSWEEFEQILTEATVKPPTPNDPEYLLFGDTATELASWANVSDRLNTEDDDWIPAGSTRLQSDELQKERDWHQLRAARVLEQPIIPITNSHRDIGRNDPCPCGSGKKYKKCCLN